MTTTQVYNQAVQFDASFINADAYDRPQFLPIKYSAFEYVEITDTLNNPSLSGYAILDNFNDSINSNPVFSFAKMYTNYFNFRVDQIVTSNTSITLDATFVLNDIYTLPQDEIANKLCIQFDDIFFGTLENKTINDIAQVARYKNGLTSDIIKNILEDYNQTGISNISDNWIDSTYPVNLQFDPAISIGQIYKLAYLNNFTSNTGKLGDSVFNLLRDGSDIFEPSTPTYTLEPINKKFLDLYSKLRGQSVTDLSDTVIEGIIESGAQPEDSRTGIIRGYSEITELQIRQPDPITVRDVYRNVVIESVNESGTALVDVLPIGETIADFYRLFCNNPNYRLDLPFTDEILEASSLGINAIKRTAAYPELEPGLTQAKLYNTILLNSKMITFKIKGQLYRKPGYFVYFQPRRQTSSSLNTVDEHYNSLVGFWYIVQVKHIFEGNAYDNVITCVNPFIRNN